MTNSLNVSIFLKKGLTKDILVGRQLMVVRNNKCPTCGHDQGHSHYLLNWFPVFWDDREKCFVYRTYTPRDSNYRIVKFLRENNLIDFIRGLGSITSCELCYPEIAIPPKTLAEKLVGNYQYEGCIARVKNDKGSDEVLQLSFEAETRLPDIDPMVSLHYHLIRSTYYQPDKFKEVCLLKN